MENNHKLEKDIILICKDRYNHEKHKSKLEAFRAYYHKYYIGIGENIKEITKNIKSY